MYTQTTELKTRKAKPDRAEWRNSYTTIVVEDVNIPLSAINRTITLKISKGIEPGDFFWGECFNCEFNFFNSYRATQMIYFILSELWWFVFSGKWPISSKLSNVCV